MTKTILVLGATGGIGGSVARVAQARGWRVVALVRDPAKAGKKWDGPLPPDWRTGDAMRRGDVLGAAAGADVIVHAVNPPGYRKWDELVLPMIDNTIAAARLSGARILMPGTIYNYNPATAPVVDEMTPQRPRGRKGEIRKELEDRLAAAAPEVRSLIVRGGDYFGPGARQSWFQAAMASALDRKIVYPGAAGVGHAWAYLPDLAEAMVRLLEAEERLAAAERVQFAGFWDADGTAMIRHLRAAARRPELPVRPFPWWAMQLLSPFGGFPREVMEVRPFWEHPLRLDNSRLVSLIGAEPATPIETAVAEAVAFARTQ